MYGGVRVFEYVCTSLCRFACVSLILCPNTQMNLPKKYIREKRAYFKLQQFYHFHLSKLIAFLFACVECQFSNMALFCMRNTLCNAKNVPRNPDKSKRVPFHVFLLIFNNTIIMRYHPCLCALQGYPFCFGAIIILIQLLIS